MDLGGLRVNGERLRASLETMAAFGATPGGGVHRLSLSDDDKRARDLFVGWLREIDLEVVVDEMGNIFGRRPGLDESLPPVLTGSHIDSQPNGGRFDGILGVMGALEVLRTLHDEGVQTLRPVVIVDWTNEEGSRFSPAMVSSGVWAGKLERDWAYSRTDKDGRRFGDELQRIGYRGAVPAKSRPFHAYYEYHIEQGPQLERLGKTIGVPKGIVCLHWYDVHIEGKANQVGPTPMEGRNDALVAAARMILAVREQPGELGGNMVATVGEIHNHPNSRNIIPGRVDFTIDIRSWDDDLALEAWAQLSRSFAEISEEHGCSLQLEEIWRVQHTPFDERLVARVEEVASRLGYGTHPMVSGAGHDASYMTMLGSTAMIFVPSKGGRSHVEVEETSWDDCAAGADVLLQCVIESAMEA